MKCPKCSNNMVELFTSWACDHCDGKTAPEPTWRMDFAKYAPGTYALAGRGIRKSENKLGNGGFLGDTTTRPWPVSQFSIGDMVEFTVPISAGWHDGLGVTWEVVEVSKNINLRGTGTDKCLGVWVPLANAHTLRKV